MNENDSSGAHRGLEQNGDASAGAVVFRSGTSALLAAVDIWSTADSRPAASEVPDSAKLPEKPAAHAPLAPPVAEVKSASVMTQRAAPPPLPAKPARREAKASPPQSWPPQRLSLALQGGGSFAAFTWGVLERLLEEPVCAFDAISGASAGSVNAVLLASGLAEGGRERARARLSQFWNRMVNEASFRSLMLLGGFSPAGSSVAFGAALRSGQFDPLDLDPLRRVLAKHVNFDALRAPDAPKLLIAATRVRDGAARLFRNSEITTDVLLASTCPPLVHCAVDIDGDVHWDGGYAANPPLVALVQESFAADLLVVQATPSRDSYVPITGAAIDRRLDQITANTALNAEIAALQWACGAGAIAPRIARIAAEDEIEGLAQRSAVDLGRAFVMALHRSGRTAADRWLRGGSKPAVAPQESVPVQPSLVPA